MKKIFLVFILISALTLLFSPVHAADENACQTGLRSLNLTPVAVACGAAVDTLNPCKFAVLILLMASMLISGENKKALKAGLMFTLAIFLAHFLIGISIFQIISHYTISFSGIFYKIVGVIAVIIGLLNIKDYFWYGGGGFIMEVPQSWRPKMKGLIRGITTPWSAFLIGLLVSLFLLPCTSGPYAIIIGLLAVKTSVFKAFLYLLLYNLIYIIPMLAIILAMYYGLSPEKAENWRKNKIRLLHLIAGLVMMALGIVTLAGWI
jgi:cytochrome c biogenesis protein CcdA